jgi:hypothetical protein
MGRVTISSNNLFPGPKGEKGDQGDPGGPPGPAGPAGTTGPQGPQGPQGIQGIQGNPGAQGAEGPIGSTGLKGDKGDKGDTGATGATGAKGDTGNTGAQGPSGVVSVTAPITNSGTSSAANIGIDTANFALKNAANTFTTSPQTINAASSAIGLIIKANVTTPGNLQEWQNSAGTILSKVESTGAANFIRMGLGGATPATSALFVTAPSADAIAVLVRGASSQSADLQQWGNNAGTAVASVNFGGGIRGNSFRSITATSIGAMFAGIPFDINSVGAIIRGNASQAANLQEWQNSAGTVIARIASNGVISASRYIFSNDNWNTSAEGRDRLYFVNAGGTFYKGTEHGFRNNSDVTIFSLSATGAAAITLTTAATIGLIVKAAASHTGNLTEWQNSSATILTSVTAAGTINFASGNTSATATGGAIAAPALVTGYIEMKIAGTTVKVPYYSN